nr:MAG TPA_asm: hypothetical protein [Caudoviricetes sp.]
MLLHSHLMYNLHKNVTLFLTYQAPVNPTVFFNISFGKRQKSIQRHFRGFQAISKSKFLLYIKHIVYFKNISDKIN